VDIYPDGGLARVRLHGSLTPEGERDLLTRWESCS
jgi:allantoicase